MESSVRARSISDRLAALSDRQREVVVLVGRGLSNRLIADTLRVSEGTIKIHLHNIYEILGVRSRIELMIMLSKRNEMPPLTPDA
jgi:two-component system nitrate/nitrite response regulator NarP